MQNWKDTEIVQAIADGDMPMTERFYRSAKAYFRSHAAALFMQDEEVDDIFQDAMIHLWREIETRRIVVRDGVLCRWNDGQVCPMTSSLTTFLLAIAKRKHWEKLRQDSHLQLLEDDHDLDLLDTRRYSEQAEAEQQEESQMRERVVADIILAMSDRCRQILTLFYYEQRTLDEILELRPENTSKEGLKTSKYKCMQRLRQTVRQRFAQLHLSV